MKKSVSIILIVVALFCVFYGIRYLENPAETKIAVLEVYENKIKTSGYVVCTEQVYSAPTSGMVYHYVQEGTRVGKGKALSTVYSGDVATTTLQELNSISQKIAELEAEGVGKSYMAGSTNSEEYIESMKDKIVSAKVMGDVSKIGEYKDRIHGTITGDMTNTDITLLEELKTKKANIEASLSHNKNDVYSQMSGIFSKNVDSLEGVLTPKNVLKYTVSDYSNISKTAMESKTNANSGQPVCKVVNNHEWYVMTVISREQAKDLKEGREIKIRFNDLPGVTANGTVEYISSEESTVDKNVVVVKFEEYKEGVLSLRHTQIEIILESYEGYKIPVSALHVAEDGTKGVLVKSEGAQILKPCNVIYTDAANQTVIITPVSGSRNMLREYDAIVIGEK